MKNETTTEEKEELLKTPANEIADQPNVKLAKYKFLKPDFKFSNTVINIITVSFGVLLAALINYLAISQGEKNEAQHFLEGLQQDLQKDHDELISDLASYKKTIHAFNYYYGIEEESELHPDSIVKHKDFIYSYILLFPNAGRYEGFKSSGKMYFINNTTLRDKILDFYQETTPVIIGISNHYNSQSERLRIYMEETHETTTPERLLITPKGKMILQKCMALHTPVVKMYEDAIHKTEEILELIEK